MLMSTAQLPSGSELLINGDFENGSDPWIVGVSDDSPVSVITEDDNTFYSVNVETVGDSFAVNMSQKVEIIQGSTYVLTFDAWSDVNRSLIAGIGLSGGDFSSAIETVDITTTMETYELTLPASEFGALDARVLFDMGADIGMINIDNVSLRVIGGNIAVNGDFENGSDPWIVGIDDASSISVVTEEGNTFYSVNVETVGNSFAVNMSQKVEIIQGNTYVLAFDAWSNVDRSLIAGIGLSGGDFSSAIETVNITTTIETYTLTLIASEFGAEDARILFDMGADIGTVNIDNVSLIVN